MKNQNFKMTKKNKRMGINIDIKKLKKYFSWRVKLKRIVIFKGGERKKGKIYRSIDDKPDYYRGHASHPQENEISVLPMTWWNGIFES